MRTLLFCLAVFCVFAVHAQERVLYTGLLPEMALSGALGEDFEFTTKVQSMHGAYYQSATEQGRWQHIHERTDLQLFLTHRLNPFWKITGGYQIRFEGAGGITHRSIQQLAAVQRKRGYRLGHRFRADQTFRSDEETEYRLRYRLSAEVALQGLSVDPSEWYLKVSDEVLFAYQADTPGLENRIVAVIGRNFSRAYKLEAGFDYRTDRFLDNDFRQRLWLSVGLYINLPG